ncbi:MAG TPA: GreA/GreB family elongation factor [Anaerolineales bacterium]|nr:GreA/GreB family elongation factor [Anaerolineales bacterium]
METQSEIISVGCRVEIILRNRAGQEEKVMVVIVPSEAADFANGYLGLNTPLAQVLIGERAGATIPYLKDDIYSIEVVSVTQSEIKPPMDAAEKREESLKKTLREVQDTNAIVFASSFTGKWGDYDPESLPKEDKPKEK